MGAILFIAVALAAGCTSDGLTRIRRASELSPGSRPASASPASFWPRFWLPHGHARTGHCLEALSEQILQEAQKLKKPVIIDFYATWCTPCRALEETTFHDASLVKQAESAFVMIKVDLTRAGNPAKNDCWSSMG